MAPGATRCVDVGESGNHPVIVDRSSQALGSINAVLNGKHDGVRANQRARLQCCGFEVAGLHAHQHDIDRAWLIAPIGSGCANGEVAEQG
jgi:hypothetical protein